MRLQQIARASGWLCALSLGFASAAQADTKAPQAAQTAAAASAPAQAEAPATAPAPQAAPSTEPPKDEPPPSYTAPPPAAAPAPSTSEGAAAPAAPEAVPPPPPPAPPPPPPGPTAPVVGAATQPSAQKSPSVTAPPHWDWPAAAHTQPPVHQGFYLRLGLGPTAFRARFAPEHGGGGASFDIAVGGTIAEGLVLFGSLDAMGSGNRDQTSASLLGVGAAYWFLEPNVYLSASIGVGRGSYLTTSGDQVRTNPGFGLSLLAGKEWLIDGGPLGLGVALQARFSTYGAGNFGSLGLLLSATVH